MSKFQKSLYRSIRQQLEWLPAADQEIRQDLIAFCETLEGANPDWRGDWYQPGDSAREWEKSQLELANNCREHNSRLARRKARRQSLDARLEKVKKAVDAFDKRADARLAEIQSLLDRK